MKIRLRGYDEETEEADEPILNKTLFFFGETHESGNEKQKNDELLKIAQEKKIRRIFLEYNWMFGHDTILKLKQSGVDIVVLKEDTSTRKKLNNSARDLKLHRSQSDHVHDGNAVASLLEKIRKDTDMIKKYSVVRERYIIKQIDNRFVNPSLLCIGSEHVCKTNDPITGKIPELMKEMGYDTETVFIED